MHRISREEAVRRLLAAHVDRQKRLAPSDRLTHISTILRHPPRPIHPGAGPDLRVQLKVRLPDELATEARRVGLALPGQSRTGGNGDYRARPLTDAIMTAIAAAEPMTDEVLVGLRPCLRHQSAIGLWRLAVAATMTSEEQRILVKWHAQRVDADVADEPLDRVVEILREERSGWHDQFRFQVARFLVRRFLSEHTDHEAMLYDQRDGFEWARIRGNYEQFGLTDEDFDEFSGWGLNLDGRGAANIWRIRRRAGLEDLCAKLFDDIHDGIDVTPPGWLLMVPDRWTAAPLSPATVAQGAREHVRAGRVLLLSTTNPERRFLWPMLHDDAGEARPVPGLDAVVTAARSGRARRPFRLQPAEIAELMLVSSLEEDVHDRTVEMPVHIAHQAGLVTDDERDHIVEAAQEATRDRMRQFLKALGPKTTDRHLRELEAALDSPTHFHRIAFRNGLPTTLANQLSSAFVHQHPIHTITVTSLAQAVADCMPEPALTWLATWFLRDHLTILREDRMQDWQRGMDNNRHRPRFAGTDSHRL